jgi:hypothetical protein
MNAVLWIHVLRLSSAGQTFRASATILPVLGMKLSAVAGVWLCYLVSARKLTIQINNNGLRLIPAKKIRRNLK